LLLLQKLKDKGVKADLRISVIPTVKGDSMVVRVLPKRKVAVDSLLQLNYTAEQERKLKGYARLNQGLIIVSGPTGSGKSTLIWWLLKVADPYGRKIVSIEDPVEAEVDGVQQVEVKRPVKNERGQVIGIDFPLAIRAFLRQNPDVIVVGEVRDGETARAVIEASNTGHLVITTLHANDEVEAVKRLIHLAKDPRTGEVDLPSVVNAIRVVVAQRLLPRICPVCLEKGYFESVEIDENFLITLPAEVRGRLEAKKGEVVPYRPGKTTCGTCKGGYKGRVPVVGILEFNEVIRDFIIEKDGEFTSSEFHKVASSTRFRDFRKSALERLSQEEVCLSDVLEIL